jgi:hypothetical protein
MRCNRAFSIAALLSLLFSVLCSSYAFAREQDAFQIKIVRDDGRTFLREIAKTSIEIPDYSQLSSRDHRIDLKDQSGNIIVSQEFALPIGAALQQGFDFYIQYSEEVHLAELYDSEGSMISEIRIDHGQLTSAAPALPLSSVNWMVWVLPIIIALAFIGYLEVSRLKHHHELNAGKYQQDIAMLKRYVATNLAKGYTRQQIISTLLKSHYDSKEVDYAFSQVQANLQKAKH